MSDPNLIRLNSNQISQIREPRGLTEEQLIVKREKIQAIDKQVGEIFQQIYTDLDAHEDMLTDGETYVNSSKKFSLWNGKGEIRLKMSGTYHKTEKKKKKKE